jgi:hypothetical protein
MDAQRMYTGNQTQNHWVDSFWQTVRYGIWEIHYGVSYFCNERAFDVPKAVKCFDIDKYLILDCQSVSSFIDPINKMP